MLFYIFHFPCVIDGAKYPNSLYSDATLYFLFEVSVLESVLAGAKYANALSIVRVSPSPVGPTVITKVNQGGKDEEQQYDEEKIMFWISYNSQGGVDKDGISNKMRKMIMCLGNDDEKDDDIDSLDGDDKGGEEHYDEEDDGIHSQEGGDGEEDFSSDLLCCF